LVGTLTQGGARGSCPPLALGYLPTPLQGSQDEAAASLPLHFLKNVQFPDFRFRGNDTAGAEQVNTTIGNLRSVWFAVCPSHSLCLCVSAVAFALLLVGPMLISEALAARPKNSGEKKPSLVSLRLFPQKATLWGAAGGQRFIALGKYSDGLERDVTSASRFSVKDPSLAALSSQGRVTARADGESVIAVELEGQRAESTLSIQETKQVRQPTFARDVEGILTRRGCNDSNCHGGVKGRGGFKLSLNGAYPRDDYKWIVEGGTYQVLTDDASGAKVPRVDLKQAEMSLLLAKPTMTVPHGGGARFEVGSAEYQTLLEWIQSRAPYGAEGESANKIERVEVFPKEAVLDSAGKQQLLVTAHLSNGRQEDITDEVLYASNNSDVVKVSLEGLVEAVKPGESAVLIRAPGYNLSTSIGVVSQPVLNYPKIVPRNFIDEQVFAKLRKFQIVPSDLASNDEFLRRMCLDVTGTLPPAHRVREFLADRDPKKREKLVEILLASPEYVDYWTFRFADLFRVALHPSGGNAKFSQFYWEWLRNRIEENKPYDQIATERIAAQGYEGASRHYLPILQPPLPQDAAAEEVRVFLGRRIDCAQCHNHPFENWAQDQFWGMAAFFKPLTFYWFEEVGTEAIVLDDSEGYSRRGNMGKVVHPRTKKEIVPAFFDGTPLPASQAGDPRMALAKWMVARPEFSETAVNRMWSLFFGRGIVNPVDDFRSTNPPSHPELLQALGRDFRMNGYDLKQLIRRIVHSRTYQLSAAPNETNKDDHSNFARMTGRPLDAEVLLDAISQVTEIPEIFRAGNGQAPPGTRAIHLKEPDMYPSQFLDVCNRPTRQMVPERNSKPSLRQALHRLAGTTYTDKLAAPGGRIDRLLARGASDREMIEEFYLSALSRFPTEEEKSSLEAAMRSEMNSKKSRRQVVEDFCWGLLNSQEFMNH